MLEADACCLCDQLGRLGRVREQRERRRRAAGVADQRAAGVLSDVGGAFPLASAAFLCVPDIILTPGLRWKGLRVPDVNVYDGFSTQHSYL